MKKLYNCFMRAIKILLAIFVLTQIFFAADLKFFPAEVKQGNSFKLELTTSSNISGAKIVFNQHSYDMYKISTYNFEIILGTTYETKPGSLPVVLKLYRQGRPLYAYRQQLTVLPRSFRISSITVPPEQEKKGATNWDTLAQENNILGAAFKRKTPKKYFSSAFARPCTYNIVSSEYGVQRKYLLNGKEISAWAHRGLDLVNNIGTPVYAVNYGVVVVSMPMTVHGQTIVIDHGQGILSIYNHLSQRAVTAGASVKKGQLIGRVGITGLVSGAHLHFGLSVNNVRVDPLEWFDKRSVLFKPPKF